MSLKGETCHGGKISKEGLTVLLCTNSVGEFEKPVIIGKAENPRCFKGVNKGLLGVDWYSNRKAWMTRDIMTQWLTKLNKLMRQKRKILLFMDNASSHPQKEFSNIVIIFLPPNTTSLSQPLDQGIIQNVKVKYRKRVLRHLLANIEEVTSASDLAKKLTVLDAIHWIVSAVKDVKPETVVHCFQKAGFKFSAEETAATINAEDKELRSLLRSYNPQLPDIQYGEIDENLSTESGSVDIQDIIRERTNLDDEEEDQEEDVEEVEEEKPMSTSEALKSIARLKTLFTAKGEGDSVMLAYELRSRAEALLVNRSLQKKVTDYFKEVV